MNVSYCSWVRWACFSISDWIARYFAPASNCSLLPVFLSTNERKSIGRLFESRISLCKCALPTPVSPDRPTTSPALTLVPSFNNCWLKCPRICFMPLSNLTTTYLPNPWLLACVLFSITPPAIALTGVPIGRAISMPL